MTGRQIPALTGEIRRLSPDLARILDPLRSAVLELIGSGETRALRAGDIGSGFSFSAGGNLVLDPIVVPSVEPEIRRRIELLEAAQTDASTIAEELLGNAQFGTLIGAVTSDAKTLKVNVNGHIAGWGVAAYGGGAAPITSDFVIQADRFSVVFPSPPWLPNQAYTLGQYVTPTTAGTNRIYRVTTAGTTDSAEPTWPTSGTVASGTVVFTAATIDERVPFVVGNVGGVPTVGIDGNLLVDGTIEAGSISAGSITADKIATQAVTADKLAANLVLAADIEIAVGGKLHSGQNAYDIGTGWFFGFNSSTPVFSIGDSGGNKITWNGSTLTVNGTVAGSIDAGSLVGTIPPSNFDISTLGWTISSTFSAPDGDTVDWTSGTLYTAAGDSFSISSGDTGNMVARTYIFFDINVSTTVLQTTTTAANAVGEGRILVAVAEDDSPSAFFQLFGGSGSFGVSSPEIPSYGPLANGDFETGSDFGWVADASFTVDLKTLLTGDYAAHIATSSTGLRSDAFVVAAGDRLLVTCVAQRDSGSLPDANLALLIRWEDATGSELSLSSASSASSANSAIQFLRLIVTAPASAARARVVIRKATGASGQWYADDVFVTPMVVSSDIDLGSASGAIDLATQISGVLTTTFAAAGLINSNVTINANGTLTGAGGGQSSLTSLPGTVDLSSKVSGTLSTSFAAAGLINANVTVNADGTLSGAGGGQASLTSLPGAISAGQINANAVTTAKLAAGAVTAAKIDAGTITANEIAASTITGNRIAANTIAAGNIVALTITAAELAANTITASKIASATITANEIAANTITAGQVALNTLTASNIAASSITGSRIAAATILGTNIAAGTITASNIAAGTISANEIAVNAIIANTIASGAVTASKLAATLIYGGEIIVDTNGLIRSGQTDYDTGVGWFLGNSGGTPRFSIGNSAGNRLTWNGSTLDIFGSLNFTNNTQSFTPVPISGFSSNPPGNINYVDLGRIVICWCDNSMTGVSNTTVWVFQGFPVSIRPPPGALATAQVVVVDNNIRRVGYIQIAENGIASVFRGDGANWTPSNQKGFGDGAVFIYTK